VDANQGDAVREDKMKITIKVAQDGDKTEGNVHSWTFLPVTSDHLAKLLDRLTNALLLEVDLQKTDSYLRVPSERMLAPDMKVEVSPEHWVFVPPKSGDGLTEADKKFLKDIGIGGLE
jgi:hypothetical protein